MSFQIVLKSQYSKTLKILDFWKKRKKNSFGFSQRGIIILVDEELYSGHRVISKRRFTIEF